MKRKLCFLVALLSIVVLSAGCVVIDIKSNGSIEYKEYGEKVFASSFKYITVENSNGAVVIEPSTDGKITVQYEKRLQGISEARMREVAPEVVIEMKENGSTLRVTTIIPHPRPSGVSSMGASYRIYLPVETFATIDTTNGMIDVKGMCQDIDLESSNGKIAVKNHLGNIVARTSNARIEIENAGGMIKVNTSNGGIDLVDIVGPIRAETSNGKISVTGKEVVSWAELDTSNASVEFNAPFNPSGWYKISTSNGSINFWVDRQYGYDFTANTSNGRIKFDFPFDFSGTHENTHVNGKLFGGGIEVNLRSSNGYITVHEMEAK